jgi:hypothetical protein
MTGTSDDADARERRRRDQLAGIHDRLTTAVADLAGSDAWQHMLLIAAHMPTYSLNNILLVAVQRPDATGVAGYRAWRAAGRQVRKGEKGIAILAPCLYKPHQEQAEPAYRGQEDGPSGAGAARILRGFRVVHVFDLSQTDGPDLPADPHLLTGPAPEHLWDRLAQLVHDDGFTLERGDCHGANGYTDYRHRVVRVRDDVDPAQAVKTLAHELGHIRADHETRFADQYRTSPRCRGQAEVEAESIAHLVTNVAGLDAGAYSVPYLAGWSGNDPTALRDAAVRVLDAADTITSMSAASGTTKPPIERRLLGEVAPLANEHT